MIRESLLALSLLGGANTADMVTTQHAMHNGGVELNSFIYGPHAERIVPVKVAVTAAETGVFILIRKKNKKVAWFYVVGVVAVNLYIAKHNNDLANRLSNGTVR